MTNEAEGRIETSRSAKIVPKSKVSEWAGLDRIAAVVHGMACIWREQEKDDIGIDGEIELCTPRHDGDGMIGTGRIVKVQSKAGSKYVIRDTDDGFASPVTDKDLKYWNGMNLPVVYIVFHPDDDVLYWKDVKAYLASHPEAFSAPNRIEFDKVADRFDGDAYPSLSALCGSAPERVSTGIGEPLYTNLLEVVRMPERIWITPVLPQKRPSFHDRLSGLIPPYAFRAGIVATLTDPREADDALSNVIDRSGTEDLSLEDWLSQGVEADDDFRRLMNGLVHRHLRGIGLSYQKHPRRYFFNRGLAVDSPLRRTWTSARTGRTNSRFVAKHHEYGKLKFFRHAALDFRFETFGTKAALSLQPQIHFTSDGTHPWESTRTKSFAIRARAKEYNDVYLNNLLFWSHLMAKGEKDFDLTVNDAVVATLSGSPIVTRASFSIQTNTVRTHRGG